MVLSMPQPVRTKSGVYYFRQRVPSDLVAAVGSQMVQFSLRTKDPKEAKERHAQELAKIQLRWKALRDQPEPLSHIQIVGLAGELYRRQIDLHVAEPHEPELWVSLLQLLERLAGGGPEALAQWYGSAADKLLEEHGLAADAASRSRLYQEAHSALAQAARHLLKQARGDYRPDPDSGRFPKLSKDSRNAAEATIGDLFDLWKREHLANGSSPRTVRDHRQKLDALIDFLGHDDAKRVTREDLARWTEELRHGKGLAARTVADKYLSAVRAVFGAGVDKFRVESNPAAAVRVRVPKPKRERDRSFSDEEALRILRAALNAPTASGETTPHNRSAFRWIPWICAYTGARVGEIAQLRKEDFLKENGVPCIRITPEAGSVKTGNFRVVPLHPHLIATGLLDFVERSPSGPLFYLPSGRQRKAGTTQANYVSGKLSQWVRQVAKVTDRRVQPNHGWRHRFKRVGRDVGIDPHYLNVVQGHADGRAATDYGETSVKALYREIQKLPRYEVDDG